MPVLYGVFCPCCGVGVDVGVCSVVVWYVGTGQRTENNEQ
jgi:hypothetical protein